MRLLHITAITLTMISSGTGGAEAHFYRIQSNTNTLITSFSTDGHLSWSNAAVGGVCTLERADSLVGTNIWRTYVEHEATTTVMRLRCQDPDPPPRMVLIPAGRFTMGDIMTEGSSDELPLRTTYVSAFYMGECEVTNDEMIHVLNWAYEQGKLQVDTSTLRNTEGDSQELLDLGAFCDIEWSGSTFVMKSVNKRDCPCVAVTWFGAAAYCNFLSEKESLSPCYDLSSWTCDWSAYGYRLPTEAEWEKAARGGLRGQRFSWGASVNHDHANYKADGSRYSYDTSSYTWPNYHPDYRKNGLPYTSPVGSFAPNGYGTYDMIGNALEWCWDHYSSTYPAGSGIDPRGPGIGPFRVLRGGEWHSSAYDCRVANRAYSSPDYTINYRGFRVALPSGQ